MCMRVVLSECVGAGTPPMPPPMLQALQRYSEALEEAQGPLRPVITGKISIVHDAVGVALFNRGACPGGDATRVPASPRV